MATVRIISSALLSFLLPLQSFAQNAPAAAAGVAAGAALTAGAGQGATTASSAGAISAPIEMNIMVYGGLKKIASQIAAEVDSSIKLPSAANSTTTTSVATMPCATGPTRQVLLEDSTSISLISLYVTWDTYQRVLYNYLTQIDGEIDAYTLQIVANQKMLTDAIDDYNKTHPTPPAPKPGTTHGRHPAVVTPSTSSVAPSAGTTTTAPSATTPIGLTYLSDISTAIGAAKSGITYAPSSFQPTTQALTTELTKELCARHIALFDSTSPVNLDDKTSLVINRMMAIQHLNSAIQSGLGADTSLPTLTESQKDPLSGLQQKFDTAQANIKNIMSLITSSASVASQLTSAFQSWVSSSDGNGNIILTDVVRGGTLKRDIGSGIPALQFTIDAAGGNTRTNNFFLLNLFYTPKPSFNGGVVVTYELRDETNRYIAGDTMKILYDYSKWKPHCFLMKRDKNNKEDDEVNSTLLSTGQQDQPERVSKWFLCEYK